MNKGSSGDEIPERDVTYIVLYDYLFTTLPRTPVLPVRNILFKVMHIVTYNGHCVLLPFLRLMPPMERFPWSDFRKILHVGQRILLPYTAVKKYCRELQPPGYGAPTLQTGDRQMPDRRICDSKDPNVTYSDVHV